MFKKKPTTKKPATKKPATKKPIKRGGENIEQLLNKTDCLSSNDDDVYNSSINSCKNYEMFDDEEKIENYYSEIDKSIACIKKNKDEFVQSICTENGGIFTAKYRIPLYNSCLNNDLKTINSMYSLDRDYPFYNEDEEKLKPVIYYDDIITNYINTLKYIKKQLKYLDSLSWYSKRVIKDYTSKAYFFYSSWRAQYLNSVDDDTLNPKKNFTFIENFKKYKDGKLKISYCFLPQIYIVLALKYIKKLDLFIINTILQHIILSDKFNKHSSIDIAYHILKKYPDLIPGITETNVDFYSCYIDKIRETLKFTFVEANENDSKKIFDNMYRACSLHIQNVSNNLQLLKDKLKEQNLSSSDNEYNYYPENEEDYIVPDYIDLIDDEDWNDIFKMFDDVLNEIINNSPDSETDLHLFRGSQNTYISSFKNILSDSSNGSGFFLINRFTSCSLDFCASFEYQNKDSKIQSNKTMMYRITIPKELKTLFIAPFSAAPTEMEILLPCSNNYCFLFGKTSTRTLKIDEYTLKHDINVCKKVTNKQELQTQYIKVSKPPNFDDINEEFKKCINKTSLNFICNMVKEKDTVRIAGDKFKNLLNRSKNRNKINKSNDYCYNIINLEEDKKATNDTENIEHIINSILINRLNFEYLLKLFETDIIRQDNSSQTCDKNIITDLFTNATTGFLNFFEQQKQAPPQGQRQIRRLVM